MREHAAVKRPDLIPLCSFVSSVVAACLICFLTTTAGCTIGKEPKHPTWNGATGAEQYERLMWKAIHDQDWKQVEFHLAPSFTGVNASGQSFDRAGWVQYWKSAPVGEFSLGEVTVQPNGVDMTLTNMMHLSGGSGAGLRVVSVWQQVKSGWTLIATSNTPVRGN